MSYHYQELQRHVGKIVRFKNKNNQWVIGKVVHVDEDGIEVEEFTSHIEEGAGYGFFGPRPFYRPRPFRPYRRYPFGAFTGFTLLPFLLW